MQVEKEYQRKGLGKLFMTALEKMARHYGMERLKLTVLTNNEAGLEFFKGIGFDVDDSSPSPREKTGYQIMSKMLI